MGLESASWLIELNSANPIATDDMAQGDDHLRLLKAVLVATFPDASKPFRFPKVSVSSASATLAVADDNTTIFSNATAAIRVYTLPTLGAGDAGWMIRVIKTDSSVNVARVVPASGTINGAANIELSVQYDSIFVVWSGTAWFALRTLLTTDEIVDLAVTTAKLATNAVTFAKMQQIVTDRFLGRITPGTGDIEGMTPTEATSLLNLFTQHASAPLKGLVPGALTADVTAGKFLSAAGTWELPSGPPNGLIVDEQSAGTTGQTANANPSYANVRLTDVLRDDGSFIVLAANKFTLDAGSYYVRWTVPGINLANFKTRLHNVTANTTLGVGSGEKSSAGTTTARSIGMAFITVVGAQELAIQFRCSSAGSLGEDVSLGHVERYSFVELWAL